MQSRKQHQRIPSRNDEKPKFPTNRNDDVSMLPGDPERVTRVSSITKKVSKKNLKAKSPLRFTNKYRKTPISFDVSEKRALRRVISRDLTHQERLKEVLAQIDRARALPKRSKYAIHKLAILGKAKQLLEEKIENIDSRGNLGVQDADGELETLLRELRIG